MSETIQKMNFRYKCKIKDIIYNIQLFNIQKEKIKMMIDTKNLYSDDYIEYSNIYSLIQFQEISRYYVLFENIDEVFSDLSQIIQEKKFSITHNGNTITFTLIIMINKKEEYVNFILDKNKVIDLSSRNETPYFKDTSFNDLEINQKNPFSIEKSKRNVEISNINELNNLLSDFKDRITILEASQNNNDLQNNIINNNIMNSIASNENINAGLENILIRLNKLESDNSNKDKIIEQLEKKLQYYESNDKIQNNNIKDNNYYNRIQTYPNTFSKNQLSVGSFYNNYQLQEQRQSALTFNKNENYNKYNNHNKYRLKQSKSEIFSNYNKENMSLQSKEINNNNYVRKNSYNEKKISYRDNKSYGEKDTFRSNKFNNFSYTNDINSSYLKTNNSNLNSTMSNYSNTKDKTFQKYLFYKEKLGIPMVPRENLKKYVNSRIIFTKNELRSLKAKLSNGNKKLHIFFDLLYRASVDGDFEEIIKNNTEDKEKTLTLFYTYEGARFGVYINTKKTTSIFKGKVYKEIPGTSFIVSLNNLRFFDIEENKTSKQDIPDYLSFGRTFYLNKNGSNWLIYTPRSNFLKKKCSIGNQKSYYKFFDAEVLVGNRNNYHIKDVEIFHVVFEKDREDDN